MATMSPETNIQALDVKPSKLSVSDTLPPQINSRGEEGFLGLETLGRGIDMGKLAIEGIRDFISNKRLQAAEKKIDSLELSAEVHRESPGTYIRRDGVDLKGKPNGTWRSPSEDLLPVTFLQRRQKIRADRRAAKALRNEDQQYFIEQTYSSDLSTPKLYQKDRANWANGRDVGTRENVGRVLNERRTNSSRRKSLGAQYRHVLLGESAKKKRKKVLNSSKGTDLPGKVIKTRIKRVEDTVQIIEATKFNRDWEADAKLNPAPPTLREVHTASKGRVWSRAAVANATEARAKSAGRKLIKRRNEEMSSDPNEKLTNKRLKAQEKFKKIQNQARKRRKQHTDLRDKTELIDVSGLV